MRLNCVKNNNTKKQGALINMPFTNKVVKKTERPSFINTSRFNQFEQLLINDKKKTFVCVAEGCRKTEMYLSLYRINILDSKFEINVKR